MNQDWGCRKRNISLFFVDFHLSFPYTVGKETILFRKRNIQPPYIRGQFISAYIKSCFQLCWYVFILTKGKEIRIVLAISNGHLVSYQWGLRKRMWSVFWFPYLDFFTPRLYYCVYNTFVSWDRSIFSYLYTDNINAVGGKTIP